MAVNAFIQSNLTLNVNSVLQIDRQKKTGVKQRPNTGWFYC